MRVFGDLETIIMAQLWAMGGQATVREVLERIQVDRKIAYTTVLSTMENLYRKGHLTRWRDGKAFRYQTALTRAEHTAGLMREALDRGERDTGAVLAHFVGDMTDHELAELHKVLARRVGGAGGR